MGLEANLEQEHVGSLALREAIALDGRTPVREAARRLREKGLGCAFVVDSQGRPRGMFTEGVLLGLLAQNRAAFDEPVERHLAPRWACVRRDDPISKALLAIEELDLRFVGVVDEEDRLVGLTGQKGLVEYVAEHFPRQVSVARAGLKPDSETREGA